MNRNLSDQPQYPELTKLALVKDKLDLLTDFLNWVDTHEFAAPNEATRESMLAEYFGIDLEKLRQERTSLGQYGVSVT